MPSQKPNPSSRRWLPPKSQAARKQAPETLAQSAGVRRLAGVDEAGRGPWAGPVVAAAVVLRRPRLAVRIDDSKRLTSAQRARAFDLILQHADVGFGIVCAQQIDTHNILRATLAAMSDAIRDLPTPPELVLVDGPQIPTLALPCWPIVHGDQRSYVISCASIMAKVLRDALMTFYHELHPQYAFDQHKGYGTSLHASRLKQWGPSVLHRRSFKPLLEWCVSSREQATNDPRPTSSSALEPSRDPTTAVAA